MIEIVQFFSKYSPWVYLILIFGFLVAIRSLLRNLNEQRDLVYGLEREITHRRVVQSVTSLIIIGLLLFGEFTLVTFLSPVIPASTLITTPTINPLLIPQSTINTGQGTMSVETPQASATQLQATGCIIGQIMISVPKAGQEIQGEIELIGTADIPNFGFYKYEYAPQGSDAWSTILAGRKAVIDGKLGNWDTTELTPGDYQLRLVVFDNMNTELPICIIPVRVIQ
ncbi:MAG: hypothetical protein A2X25_02065 [Chloroflexi bacterium GWB2_49_20]|nr:MAG: hypothetical protein A2X25_02065 [Chloroflexi bacterium GWB2_49_20]OGN78232.1 MAG: hypothetical protein A2X26_14670 [Chloroflexi bacterium GWC2_49_37]OGN85268.1 MAG: hypothetical protein A2X27_07325 [Chloroflexi bacterium GWD2_49_16]